MDFRYKAKVDKKWLRGRSLTDHKEDASEFETEQEPIQVINQLKRDGKIPQKAKIKIVKHRESTMINFEKIYRESLPVEDRDEYNMWLNAKNRVAKMPTKDRIIAKKILKRKPICDEIENICSKFFGEKYNLHSSKYYNKVSAQLYDDNGNSYPPVLMIIDDDNTIKFWNGFAKLVKEICHIQCQIDFDGTVAKFVIPGKREQIGRFAGELKKDYGISAKRYSNEIDEDGKHFIIHYIEFGLSWNQFKDMVNNGISANYLNIKNFNSAE